MPAERRALRAKAHHLSPCVSIGQQGLTAAVLHEVDVALRAHELIKIRVFSEARDERERFLVEICDALEAAPVQHLGKLLIVWRKAPEPIPAETPPAARRQKRSPATRGKERQSATHGKSNTPVVSSRRRRASARGH